MSSRAIPILVVLTLIAAAFAVWTALSFIRLETDAVLLTDSTVGELAAWMAEQSGEDAPESVLGQYAKNRAADRDEERLDVAILLNTMRNLVFVWGIAVALLIGAGVVGLLNSWKWSRYILLTATLGLVSLLFVIPVIEGYSMAQFLMIATAIMLVVLLFSPGRITPVIGFFVVVSSILITWETLKSVAHAADYKLAVPQPGWEYDTYPTLDDALSSLQNGNVDAVVVDTRDIRDVMLPFPAEEEDMVEDDLYPDLRWLKDIGQSDRVLMFPVVPSFPGRLTVAVRAEDQAKWSNVFDLMGTNIATVAGEFADESYFQDSRELVLLDLKIFNDLNLPHLQSIAEALLQPARRNGPFLLIRILGDAALYTFGEALLGFVFGSVLGFMLGTLFAHSTLLERSLLPYIVASQTVPILAIAPMVVIWLGASSISVSVIAAYITFFPVTINTLRGLLSPKPTEIELMHSYAASRRDIMIKLRFPTALPYIFTALKVSATSSVVGAIIGELPSGISDGLGRAILNFSSDYSLVSTPKLWAAIVIASCVGICFFVAVSIVESLVLRRYVRIT